MPAAVWTKRYDRLRQGDIGAAPSGNLKPLFVSVNFHIDPYRGRRAGHTHDNCQLRGLSAPSSRQAKRNSEGEGVANNY
jgi:hypothetical protein